MTKAMTYAGDKFKPCRCRAVHVENDASTRGTYASRHHVKPIKFLPDLLIMSKRSATELAVQEGEPLNKAHGAGTRRESIAANEMGEFEDAWEDELESDEDVVDAGEDEGREDGVSLVF